MSAVIDLTGFDHPAMGLDQAPFDSAAELAALHIYETGYAHVELTPGGDDGTRYELLIARAMSGQTARYVVASTFGAVRPWNGNPTIHPEYAAEHYVTDHSSWTAVVYARFLNTLAPLLPDAPPSGAEREHLRLLRAAAKRRAMVELVNGTVAQLVYAPPDRLDLRYSTKSVRHGDPTQCGVRLPQAHRDLIVPVPVNDIVAVLPEDVPVPVFPAALHPGDVA